MTECNDSLGKCTVKQSYTYLMVVHFHWYGSGSSMISWLVCDVQVVVAMITRSVISCSEQFNSVQHVDMMTIYLLQHAMLFLR